MCTRLRLAEMSRISNRAVSTIAASIGILLLVIFLVILWTGSWNTRVIEKTNKEVIGYGMRNSSEQSISVFHLIEEDTNALNATINERTTTTTFVNELTKRKSSKVVAMIHGLRLKVKASWRSGDTPKFNKNILFSLKKNINFCVIKGLDDYERLFTRMSVMIIPRVKSAHFSMVIHLRAVKARIVKIVRKEAIFIEFSSGKYMDIEI
ncbi:A disintegrin and metalloproteinase with thrombospondin motifs 9 isoform X1 [Vespula squamosa]|uniref:A disintegrin and metalloproteinase with thrombospondin motifs 9 isoform X1 n=1 Tax=Vespula squamosa TaxID=30214 RepID=A0ABD2AX90_VESSQ